MSLAWGEVSGRVLAMLAEFGPMTRAEICKHMGRQKDEIAAVISRLHKRSPRAGKRIYIQSYAYDQEGERYYPRAVYALGDKPDAKRPKSDPLEIKRRYWARSQLKLKANSVFNLGLSRAQLRAMRKKEGSE